MRFGHEIFDEISVQLQPQPLKKTRGLKVMECHETKKDVPMVISFALDGGGVRGIMQTYWMLLLEQMINEKLGNTGDAYKPIGEFLDSIGGTSIGGILAMAYFTPDPRNPKRGLRTAKEIYDFFSHNMGRVFSGSMQTASTADVLPSGYFARFVQLATNAMQDVAQEAGNLLKNMSINGARHDPSSLEELLAEFFGGQTLNHVEKPLFVTSANRKTNEGFPFRSSDPQQTTYKLKDIGRATSAAPTFFPAADIAFNPTQPSISLVDGGIAFNNPSAVVLAHTIQALDTPAAPITRHNVFLVSLGTGDPQGEFHMAANIGAGDVCARTDQEGWGLQPKAIINALMAIGSRSVHEEVLRHVPGNYFRINPPVSAAIELDSASKETLDTLLESAGQRDVIDQLQRVSDRIVEILKSRRPR